MIDNLNTNIVIAIQTQAPMKELEYSCNNNVLLFNPAHAGRAMLASLLQARYLIQVFVSLYMYL